MHRKFGRYSGSVFCLQRIVDEATHSATLTLSAVLLSTPHVLRRNRAINRGSGSRRKLGREKSRVQHDSKQLLVLRQSHDGNAVRTPEKRPLARSFSNHTRGLVNSG